MRVTKPTPEEVTERGTRDEIYARGQGDGRGENRKEDLRVE